VPVAVSLEGAATSHRAAAYLACDKDPLIPTGEKPGTLQGTQTLFNIEIAASHCAGYFYTFAQRASNPAPMVGQEKPRRASSSSIAGIRVQALHNRFRAEAALPAHGADLTARAKQPSSDSATSPLGWKNRCGSSSHPSSLPSAAAPVYEPHLAPKAGWAPARQSQQPRLKAALALRGRQQPL